MNSILFKKKQDGGYHMNYTHVAGDLNALKQIVVFSNLWKIHGVYWREKLIILPIQFKNVGCRFLHQFGPLYLRLGPLQLNFSSSI